MRSSGGGIDQLQLHLKGGDIVELDRPRRNAPHLGGKALIGEGIHPHAGHLAHPKPTDVVLGHLGQHLQPLGQFHHRGTGGTGGGRRCGGGCHKGAGVSKPLGDHPIEGGPHDQLLPFHLTLLQPLTGRSHVGLIHVKGPQGPLIVVSADRLAGKQLAAALPFTAGAGQLGLGRAQIGLQFLEAFVEITGIHPGESLALPHPVALLDVELLQQPLPLRAHVHPPDRIQFAAGAHHAGKGALPGQHGVGLQIAALLARLALPERGAAQTDQQHQSTGPDPPPSPERLSCRARVEPADIGLSAGGGFGPATRPLGGEDGNGPGSDCAPVFRVGGVIGGIRLDGSPPRRSRAVWRPAGDD